jgi:protein-L-isoaspartate O-methyltransferase
MIAKALRFYRHLITAPQCLISVYDGISPALLATMSLSQGVAGRTNDELIDSLVKANIIRSRQLEAVMRTLDRKWFISEHTPNYYLNKPYKISGGQTMTDIFTHAIILEEVCLRIQQIVSSGSGKYFTVLDIGTGHGYLAFAIAALFRQLSS